MSFSANGGPEREQMAASTEEEVSAFLCGISEAAEDTEPEIAAELLSLRLSLLKEAGDAGPPLCPLSR
jgi:hypothetical protein